MENISKLTSWALANAANLKFKVERYRWIDEWLPGFYDFSVLMDFRNHPTLLGRGIAQNEELAFIKAFSEVLERSVMYDAKLSDSNGMAAHDTPEKARECAVEELMERDGFFCHWLTQTPFFKLNVSDYYSELPWLEHTISLAKKKGVEINLAQVSSCHGFTNILCTAFGQKAAKPFGVILGIGCKKTINRAIEQALLEAIRNIVSYFSDKTRLKIITPEEFNALPKVTPEDHINLAFHFSYADMITKLFSENPACIYSSIFDPVIDVVDLPPAAEFSSAPIAFARATSTEIQPAFFGKTRQKYINLDRLTGFAQTDIIISDVCTIPHPFG